MIEIRYSPESEKTRAMADISGTWKEFEVLRQTILKFLERDRESLFVETEKDFDSEGWDLILEGLEIDQKGETVRVSMEENRILKITGSKPNLEIFADWLEFDKDTPSDYHSHYEYFDGNEHINPKSEALVIRIK